MISFIHSSIHPSAYSNSPQRERRHENHHPHMMSPSKGPQALSYYEKKSSAELSLITASLARHRSAAASGNQTGVLSPTIKGSSFTTPTHSALSYYQKKSSAELTLITAANGNHATIQPPASTLSISARSVVSVVFLLLKPPEIYHTICNVSTSLQSDPNIVFSPYCVFELMRSMPC